MNKKFLAVLPDEPYKTTTKLNRTVECEYNGPRYLMLRIEEKDGHVYSLDKYADDMASIEEFEKGVDPEPGFYYTLLDADKLTWEAAYLTGSYSHTENPDYQETLPNGEVYQYHYDDEHGACNQCFYTNDMYHDRATNTFKRPKYRVHAVKRSEFDGSVNTQIEHFTNELQSGRYNDEQLKEVNAYLAFLKSIATTYKGVDHWKIKFPPYPGF
jgi:hypothetical protein